MPHSFKLRIGLLTSTLLFVAILGLMAQPPEGHPSFNHSKIDQSLTLPRHYKHKIIVDSVMQTSKYTYVKSREKVKEKDSLLWVALPSCEPLVGQTYYYETGLPMGFFESKELKRTFNQILFLSCLGTASEMSPESIIPKPVNTYPTQEADVPVRTPHYFVIKEIQPAGGYVYLHVIEEGKEEWLAMPNVPAVVGKKYSYNDAALMKQFYSKELKKTFPEVLFVSKISVTE